MSSSGLDHQRSAATPPAPTSTLSSLPDTVILHVLSPSAEVAGGRITFPSIPLDTSIGHLKSRIQNSIPAAPPPERQRLIYRGRPLTDLTHTLRRVFQSELNSPETPSSLTLHLVLPPGPPSPQNAPGTSPVHQDLGAIERQQATPPPPPPPPLQMNQGLPQPLHHHHHHHAQHQRHHFHHQALAQAQASQMMLQHQLNLLQQQLGANNLPIPHGQAQFQTSHGTNLPPNHTNTHSATPIPPFFPPVPNVPNLQAMMAQHQEHLRAQAGLHGIHNHMHGQHPHGNASGGQNPPGMVPHAQAGGMSQMPMTTTIRETIGPNGQRTRVVVNETMNIQMSRQGTPVQASTGPPIPGAVHNVPHRSTTAPNVSEQRTQGQTEDSVTSQVPRSNIATPRPIPGQVPSYIPIAPASGTGSALLIPSEFARLLPSPSMSQQPQFQPVPAAGPGRLAQSEIARLFPSQPISQQRAVAPSPAQTETTTAWLLASPSGPQALVFAPSHGMFSSPNRQMQNGVTPFTRTSHRADGPRFQQTPNGHIRPQNLAEPANVPALPPAANNANPQPAQMVVRRQVQVNNDLFVLAFQRGWLFLRLYIFMFFLSEPGTWRHWFFLFLAVFVCLMPRAPARDLFNFIRGTIDDLLAPRPEPTQPDQRRHDGSGGGGRGTTGTRRTGTEPTPEEAAARLIRDRHGQRNIFRETLYRVERALALFIASLVPGVGERHVRAREDARRAVERIENERAAAEAATEDQGIPE